MKTKLMVLVLTVAAFSAAAAQAQLCVGFTTDANDFIDVPEVGLLPHQGFGDPQPFVRGDIEYTGPSLDIGTNCPGSFGVLSLCDFSSIVTGVPVAGTTLRRFGLDYWADVGINPFKLTIELQSGAIEVFTASANSGFVGFCAPVGETIVRLEMEGHDGTATALYHGEDSPVATDAVDWGTIKVLYRD